MGAPLSKLLVAVEGTQAIVKICGRASFMCSGDFKALVYDLRERGCRRFVLDLGECVIMDSTFLGILARFAQRLAEPADSPATLVLLNPNARILDLLENLGMTGLFKVERGDGKAADQCVAVASPAEANTREAKARACLEAHETLMELNPANVPKFKEVTRFMAEDLKKMEKSR